MRINPKRPVEPLIGIIYRIVRIKMGNLHINASKLEAARHCRPKGVRKAPIALRRGWALAVLELHQKNMNLYKKIVTRF